MDNEQRIEHVMASRKPRTLTPGEVKCVEEHIRDCKQCLQHKLGFRATQCTELRLWMTECKAYNYYESEAQARRFEGKNWKLAQEEQRSRNPNLHMRLWEGVRWLFPPEKPYEYVRVQWRVSTYQVISGHIQGKECVEELVYHTYAQIE